MRKTNTKRHALFTSVISLLLCVSMLMGTTFAWFTDSVKSGINTIAAGVLDVELYHSNAAVTEQKVDAATKLFMDLQGKPILWEPGVVSYENLRVVNAGELALAYQLAINTANENFIVDPSGAQYGLSQILKVGVVPGGITATDRAGVVASVAETDWTTLSSFLRSGSLLPEGAGTSEETWGVVIYWQPGENDNLWNLNNGKTLSSGEVLQIDLGVRLLATQESYESDSFGSDFDTQAKAAVFPNFVGGSASAAVVPNEQNQTAAAVTMSAGAVAATVPVGVQLAQGVTELKLDVSMMGASGANITLGENEDMRSLDVHIEGVAANNTTPITVTLKEAAPMGLNLGNYKVYHVEADSTKEMTLVAAEDDFTAHNQFKYDPATGDVTLYMATFSEVAFTMESENAWKGEFDYSWYTNVKARTGANDYTIANADQLAGFGAIVGGMNGQTQDDFSGKTVKLISNINLGDKEADNKNLIFYPIGYYNSTDSYEKSSGSSVTSSVSSFEGTFDGNGHTISNFYQNTWEMFGDYNDGYSGTPNHYKDAMGLFGYVYGGTVKNLAVSHFSSDGEFTPTGVIAAYAAGNATFENIAIFNCNPRVYNTGNGGIIGIAGDTSANNDDHITLKNITVDNSNKISALWGSYDVACGGLVGMYRGNVDGSGNATGDTISFENCHVSAIMDVYNDVCANYQYYAYRYTGMIIGSVRHNTTSEGKTIPNMTGISATGCTVHFGTWNDYYYCEIIDNTTASYTHDYQMSRLTEIKAIDGTTITYLDGTTGTVPASGRANYVIVDYTKGHGTENATCYHFKDGAVWTHDMGGIQTGIDENGDGQDDLKEDKQHLYLEFNNLFTGYGWGVSSMGIDKWNGITALDVTVGDQEESVEKFETKFTGDFLYRVGNLNAVSLGNLFAQKKDVPAISSSGVYVTVEAVDEKTNVSGVFNNENKDGKKDWTEATIQFSGTGIVKVTIQDFSFCKPFELTLEVVEAKNYPSPSEGASLNATSNNVVLLANSGFSSVEVSGGYTLYGNGFTMTCASDSAALDMGYSFVTLNNGTLDNVQIVTPNFDYAVLYKSNMTESGNRSETTDKTRYFNVKSGVMVSGNSQILNSRISGGRAAVNVSGGNCVIDNSRIELGAVASLLVGSANSLTLRDVTLVQKPTASTYDSSKTLMGFSGLFICGADGNAAPVTLEGTLVQNAWVDENDKQYVPSAGQSIISTVLGKTEYLHDLDGDGTKESLNLGFAYMPESLSSEVNTTTITDNRTNKSAVPYDYAEVSILNGKTYVYSYKNTNGTNDGYKTESEYVPNKYGDIITVTYSDTADGLTGGKTFGTDGWVYELNVDLDKLSGYALDFSKLSMSVNGVTATDFKVNGNAKPTSPVAVAAGGTTYTLTATVDGKEYTAIYKVTGTETSKESPSKISGPTAAGFGVAKSYGGDWSGAADVLTGVKIKYWSVAENKYIEYDFSNFTVPGNAGKLNGTNNYWEYTHTNNDFTLKVTNTVAIHSGKSVYGMPIRGTDGKLYFTISSTNGYVGSGTTSRAITMQYEFTDNNGGEKLTFTHTFNISYDENNQYSYSDLSGSGTLTILENSSSGSGGGCVTGDTLVTLADGSKKRIDQLTYADKLLVWDFFNGKYAKVPAAAIINHGTGIWDVITLKFSDGTVVKAVTAHAFFDADLNKFVMITPENTKAYIGHAFVKETNGGYTTTKLVSCTVEKMYTDSYSLVSALHYNFTTEGMFSLTNLVPDLIAGLEIGRGMKYDEKTLKADIAKYGLYPYEAFADYVTEDQFNAFNGGYLKISAEKGYITYEEIVDLIARFVNPK